MLRYVNARKACDWAPSYSKVASRPGRHPVNIKCLGGDVDSTYEWWGLLLPNSKLRKIVLSLVTARSRPLCEASNCQARHSTYKSIPQVLLEPNAGISTLSNDGNPFGHSQFLPHSDSFHLANSQLLSEFVSASVSSTSTHPARHPFLVEISQPAPIPGLQSSFAHHRHHGGA